MFGWKWPTEIQTDSGDALSSDAFNNITPKCRKWCIYTMDAKMRNECRAIATVYPRETVNGKV